MYNLSKIFLIILLLLEISCSSFTKSSSIIVNEHIRFDANSTEVILNAIVNRSPVQVYVYPETEPQNLPTALFVPFRMVQKIENFASLGHSLSSIVWQNWVQQKIFPALEFSQTTPPFRPDIAIAAAAEKGADLVIGGYITYFIDGGTISDTHVAIAIEIYDVKTGNLVWSMAQAGSIQTSKISDYILFTTSRRMPTNPSSAVTNALAEDMGKKVKNWITPQYDKAPWYQPQPSAF